MEATEGFAGWVLNAFQLQRTRVHHIKPAVVKGNVYACVVPHTYGHGHMGENKGSSESLQ